MPGPENLVTLDLAKFDLVKSALPWAAFAAWHSDPQVCPTSMELQESVRQAHRCQKNHSQES